MDQNARSMLSAAVEGRVPGDTVVRVLDGSRFLRDAVQKLAATDDALVDFAAPLDGARIRDELQQGLADAASTDQVLPVLRKLRRRYMARLCFRDLAGLAELDETLRSLSELADACVSAALETADRWLQARHGVPVNAEGERIVPVVLGMGKLGGWELNFSSDIDLIFCHSDTGDTVPASGQSVRGLKPVSAGEYFSKLAQETTRLLVAQTVDGFVFRVDTMLRPFGSVGALSASFPAMEEYYQVHGREWERYALIKARPIAGDLAAGERLLQLLQPFVYRRYLDYNAVGNLRELKRMIENEVRRKGQEYDVKLGSGGIREIEFIVQSFQLVRGGAEAPLRSHCLRPTLRYLGQSGHLLPEAAERLDQAYVFLRRLENAIQMYDDRQTHALPTDAEACTALLAALNLPDWDTLMARFEETRRFVRTQFEQVFIDTSAQVSDPHQRLVERLWLGTEDEVRMVEGLRDAGFAQAPEQALEALHSLQQVRLIRAMHDEGAERLRVLLARLLADVLQQAQPEQALSRTLRVIEAVAGRSTYLTLLRDSATAREHLVRLCAASPWLTDFIARTPMVLDNLLDARALFDPPERDALVEDLAVRCADLQPPADTERAMEVLRQFQKEVTLRLAAADLLAGLPVVKVSDRLTWLAEVIVDRALHFVWTEMVAQYGQPLRRDGLPAGFGVIAYGKFGGAELGYGSDLDLVFLHDCDQPDADSVGGPRAIDNGTFFARLARRLINWLSTQTAAGRAYEVDMELRPNGRSGLLVSSVASFAGYQRDEAWTWEHQALTRARFVAGNGDIGECFAGIRRDVLCRAREDGKLRKDIVEMRAKMRDNLDRSTATEWDIKQGAGGLIDIEFITQYLVLRDSARDPAIAQWTDNWRQLEALERAGSIDSADVGRLIESYRRYRNWSHGRALQSARTLTPAKDFLPERREVEAIRRRILGA